MGVEVDEIEVALLKICRTQLGVEAKTATDGLRHELGITSQRVRAHAAALKFRNNILSLKSEDYLVRRVYDALRGEGGFGTARCGVKYLEDLTQDVEWTDPEALSKGRAKEFAKSFVRANQVICFGSCLERNMSTLRNYEGWTDADRTELAAYLKRLCPINLREGRRLKTRLRLGCHPLRSSAARMALTRNAECPCCGRGSETITHTVFDCPKFDSDRSDFFGRLEELWPQARDSSNAKYLETLMGDDPPQEIENLLYRSLISIFKRRLDILAAQGEGL